MTTPATLPGVNATSMVNEANVGSATSGSGSNVERRCDNTDCNAAKLITHVGKRIFTTFVTDARVGEQPLLMSGFTTIFRVEGTPAKFGDLGVLNPSDKPNTVYRIMPNTHAHLLNYVVVENDGESLAKIQQNDPTTMSKLLESQNQSAEQMLKKLIAGKYSNAAAGGGAITNSPLIATPNVGATAAPSTPPAVASAGIPPFTPAACTSTSTPVSSPPSAPIPTSISTSVTTASASASVTPAALPKGKKPKADRTPISKSGVSKSRTAVTPQLPVLKSTNDLPLKKLPYKPAVTKRKRTPKAPNVAAAAKMLLSTPATSTKLASKPEKPQIAPNLSTIIDKTYYAINYNNVEQ